MTAAERSAALRDVPASVGQRLLWFLDRYRAGGAALNCPLVCRLDGPLDVPRLRASIGLLVSRHEALRTTIERRGRLLRQVVHATPDPRLDVVDVSAEYDAEQSALRGVERELRTRIDPGGFPVRATLWKIAAYSHLFCLNVHHLASDAWSGWIQMRDVTSFYAAGAAPSDAAHQPALQYADFTARQDDYLRSAGFAQDLRYWREHLAGARFDTVPLAAADAARPRRT
ncbi:MAG: condensation domain-containing protein, partial [Candidatus Eremiobacteraeota bacterium]|nr:condensation domain-containing protein [Candidatus Eremiobacteraeota bacterium]